jgi:hypothetical protein
VATLSAMVVGSEPLDLSANPDDIEVTVHFLNKFLAWFTLQISCLKGLDCQNFADFQFIRIKPKKCNVSVEQICSETDS